MNGGPREQSILGELLLRSGMGPQRSPLTAFVKSSRACSFAGQPEARFHTGCAIAENLDSSSWVPK